MDAPRLTEGVNSDNMTEDNGNRGSPTSPRSSDSGLDESLLASQSLPANQTLPVSMDTSLAQEQVAERRPTTSTSDGINIISNSKDGIVTRPAHSITLTCSVVSSYKNVGKQSYSVEAGVPVILSQFLHLLSSYAFHDCLLSNVKEANASFCLA
jgi:hypothetical protein